MKTQTLPIVIEDIWKIKSNPNNPRIIKDDKFAKLVKSIKEFPEMLQIRPIVVNADMVVLGGNMRLKACKEAGLKEVPVIKATDLTDEQQREFIIKDNSGFGEWDTELLANEWSDLPLSDWGLDLPEFTVWEETAEEDDYVIPDEITTDIVLGDLFEIGEHRLLCGDSTKVDDIEKLMKWEKVDMVFTDPPYWMNLDTDFSDIDWGNYRKVKWDNEDFSPSLISTIFDNFWYCKEIMLWGGDYFAEYIIWKNEWSWIVWDKREWEWIEKKWDPDAMIWSMFELLWSKKRRRREIVRFQWAGSFWLHQDDVRRIHPTQKPYKMLVRILEKTKWVKKVVDPYLWSGSMMVACHETKRKCYWIEFDVQYCQAIIDRMKKLDPSLIIKRNWEIWD